MSIESNLAGVLGELAGNKFTADVTVSGNDYNAYLYLDLPNLKSTHDALDARHYLLESLDSAIRQTRPYQDLSLEYEAIRADRDRYKGLYKKFRDHFDLEYMLRHGKYPNKTETK